MSPCAVPLAARVEAMQSPRHRVTPASHAPTFRIQRREQVGTPGPLPPTASWFSGLTVALRSRQSPPPLRPHVPALASLSLTDASGRQWDPVPSLSLLPAPSSTRTSHPLGSVGDPSLTLRGLGPRSVGEDARPPPPALLHLFPEPDRLLGSPPLCPRVGPSLGLGTLCKARLCRPLFQEAFPHSHTPQCSTRKGPCHNPALTNPTEAQSSLLSPGSSCGS